MKIHEYCDGKFIEIEDDLEWPEDAGSYEAVLHAGGYTPMSEHGSAEGYSIAVYHRDQKDPSVPYPYRVNVNTPFTWQDVVAKDVIQLALLFKELDALVRIDEASLEEIG